MHVSKVVRARRFRLSYLITLSVVALLAAQVWDGGIAWAVTPVTAGCTGTTGDMAGLAAAVAAVTTGQTAQIDLVAGCTYTFDSTTPGPLTLAQGISLTIEGNGATITGAAPVGTSTNGSAIISGAYGGTTPSTLTVDNITFSGNSAISGGAIYDETYGSTLHVTNSTFLNNSAVLSNSGGGAIYANGGTVTIDNSTFASNHADNTYESGGAIFSSSATVTITNSTFSGNTANAAGYSVGGAIYNSSGWLNVTNSTFSGNSAANWGGAIMGYGGSGSINVQVIKNSTFSGNTAGVAGAAFYNSYAGTTLSGNLFNANKVAGTVQSCVNYQTTLTDQGYNVADDATCFNAGSGDVPTTAAAIGLGSLASNGGPTQTMAITSGSSAYHAVAAAMCPATDQRGHPRLAVSTTFCDAGAFEVDTATIPIAVTVTGSQTYGGSPTFSYPATPGVTGTATCTTVNGGTSITPTLAAGGSYTIDGTSCSGLSTDASHSISYVGGAFSVAGVPDLGLTLSAGAAYASYGETLVYTAILSNSGSAAATNVGIDFGLSAGLNAVNATWSCSAAGGASCPASSSASMTVPSLPIGGTLTWTLHVTVLTTTPDPTVTVQVSLNGTMLATNTAILVIFRNGFD